MKVKKLLKLLKEDTDVSIIYREYSGLPVSDYAGKAREASASCKDKKIKRIEIYNNVLEIEVEREEE